MPSLTISVITATLNSATTLVDCLRSVKAQRGKVEHIVIDGKSEDDTLQLLRAEKIEKMISEPDKGLYDAINKGIALSTGDVVGVLHSDDLYADGLVLEKVREVFENSNAESCYGDLVYVDRRNTAKVNRYWKSGPFRPDRFYWGWMPPHPTFFVRRSVYERHGGFSLSLGSAADYELMLRFLLKHKVSTTYIPTVLVKMRSGGTSNASLRNRFRAHRMDRNAWTVNGLKPYPWTLYLKPLSKMCQFFPILRKAEDRNSDDMGR